ncbi:hypothetical protein H3Z85_00595 [Chryseobacterium indologenes]|uniref:Uncharacterized protein n=3 Tax=Chryseobacterium TaxID=59732 RepID=A0A3G6RM05_CHRLC|nr:MULTISPECIES: hypothetical protein [Bacteroidota]AZA84535.1 hypothetical protein EG342_22730 [Chryseobacterium lactis]AZB04923.1 hypothetical protein EG341_13610 [Chryseobacterium lactis]KMQ64402.1 hypothetical protein ACM46_08960 [Chryseobacterium angstadtii]MBF6643662.1 hypothetical protein [Chryseobacterium indologenes]PNW14654.1 hypothetical protein C1637_06760 [Chryseobacterium lactis]
MGKRVKTEIGDIFSVELENGNKKYFQYIANDRTQLNSDVIRSFKREYPARVIPDYSELLKGDIEFHAHTVINIGVKQGLYMQEGKSIVYPTLEEVLFRDTNDYGNKVGDEPIKVSERWFVWKINDEGFRKVGKLEGENRIAEIGIVIPPFAIAERIRTGKYNFVYPDFD